MDSLLGLLKILRIVKKIIKEVMRRVKKMISPAMDRGKEKKQKKL